MKRSVVLNCIFLMVVSGRRDSFAELEGASVGTTAASAKLKLKVQFAFVQLFV